MEEGTNEVEKGIQLADKAGESLHGIVSMTQTLTDMVSQIAAASEQQSSASEQISKNVEAISTVTGETASGTQQIARAAEDLNRLTENLQMIVGKFKLTSDPVRHHTVGGGNTIKRHKSKLATQRATDTSYHIELALVVTVIMVEVLVPVRGKAALR